MSDELQELKEHAEAALDLLMKREPLRPRLNATAQQLESLIWAEVTKLMAWPPNVMITVRPAGESWTAICDASSQADRLRCQGAVNRIAGVLKSQFDLES